MAVLVCLSLSPDWPGVPGQGAGSSRAPATLPGAGAASGCLLLLRRHVEPGPRPQPHYARCVECELAVGYTYWAKWHGGVKYRTVLASHTLFSAPDPSCTRQKKKRKKSALSFLEFFFCECREVLGPRLATYTQHSQEQVVTSYILIPQT